MDVEGLLKKGLSFEEFVNQEHDTYQEKILEVYHDVQINDSLKNQIQSIHKKIYVLVFAELWCPDCIINVSAIQKMKDINPKISIAIVSKEENKEIMRRYSLNTKPKMPMMIILNQHFKQIGLFTQQPKVFKKIIRSGNQVEVLVAKRKYKKGGYIEETIKEILGTL